MLKSVSDLGNVPIFRHGREVDAASKSWPGAACPGVDVATGSCDGVAVGFAVGEADVNGCGCHGKIYGSSKDAHFGEVGLRKIETSEWIWWKSVVGVDYLRRRKDEERRIY